LVLKEKKQENRFYIILATVQTGPESVAKVLCIPEFPVIFKRTPIF